MSAINSPAGSGVITAAAESSAWRTKVFAMGGFPGYVPNLYPFHSDDWRRPAGFFQVDKARNAGILPAISPEIESGAYPYDGYIVQAVNGNLRTYGVAAVASAVAEEVGDVAVSTAKKAADAGKKVLNEVADATGLDHGIFGALAKALGIPRELAMALVILAAWAFAQQLGFLPPIRKVFR